MNQDEHQRERMRAWVAAFTATIPTDCGAHVTADGMLASFDKRFPAPAAVGVAKTPTLTTMSLDVAETILAQEAELASLRTKALLWDAVASGKVSPRQAASGRWAAWYDHAEGRQDRTAYKQTAEEAVQAAIDAGALE